MLSTAQFARLALLLALLLAKDIAGAETFSTMVVSAAPSINLSIDPNDELKTVPSTPSSHYLTCSG
jgi:hypothetical protein